MQRETPEYGIDSPGIVLAQLALGITGLGIALRNPGLFGVHTRWLGLAAGAYFLYGALGMLYYSTKGKQRYREQLLEMIAWRGDEIVLDIGCGRGLLLIGAARRLTTGRAIGIDIWNARAMTGNRPGAVLHNARIEGVADRVETTEGDARSLPFADNSCDVVLSNFLLHEMRTAADRRRMVQEIIRVLKPGGRLALIDFIFTNECANILRHGCMVEVTRTRLGGLHFWISAILMLGTFQHYAVTAKKGCGQAGS